MLIVGAATPSTLQVMARRWEKARTVAQLGKKLLASSSRVSTSHGATSPRKKEMGVGSQVVELLVGVPGEPFPQSGVKVSTTSGPPSWN